MKDQDLEGVKSVREGIEKMGLAADHERALAEIPAYAHKFEELVARDIPKGKTRRESADQTIARANRRHRQFELELGDDRIRVESTDNLIDALERIFPAFFFMHEGREISLRGALESLELWDKAIEKMQGIATAQRHEADTCNRGIKAAHEIRERMEDTWKN
jgi:hypothetical protein